MFFTLLWECWQKWEEMFASKHKTIQKKVKKLKPHFLNTYKYYNYLDNLGHERLNNDNTYRPNTIS